MSVEDRIRRAEEIYYKRKQNDNSKDKYNVIIEEKNIKKDKKNIKLFKKMFNQILVCIIIYSIFYIIINNNYVFSEDFTNKIREIMSQDIDLSKIYSFITTKFNEIMENNEIKQEVENLETEENNVEATEEQNIVENQDNIGGAEENITNNEEVSENTQQETTEVVELSQMEQDALYIKNSISFIKPVEGIISSKFGLRNPTVETVPKNHTGTDIAANSGTPIVSATEGTVTLVSTEGDYGNHIKVQINDVIIIYAHCKELLVNQGDIIKQGQNIATVGSTGNSTGPHLHFEIRYQDRYVDPELILEL